VVEIWEEEAGEPKHPLVRAGWPGDEHAKLILEIVKKVSDV